MAEHSSIEWTDATWNPITGCSVVSPGCTNCYAMKLAGTRLRHHPSRSELTIDTKAGPVWNGRVRLNEEWIDQPLKWKRPRMIFVCAHGDLFHEDVPDSWIDQVFAVMALASQHTFQVLTKRPRRMLTYLTSTDPDSLRDRWYRSVPAGKWRISVSEAYAGIHPHASEEIRELHHRALPSWPLLNVWLGVSAEDQARANARIPHLLETPAAIRFLSAEPLLGAMDLTRLDQPNGGFGPFWLNALRPGEMGWFSDEQATIPTEADPLAFSDLPSLDWVIVGGESGSGARPMHPEWARSMRDQCASADVPFFFKQWGNWAAVSQMSEEQIDACYAPLTERHPDATRASLASTHVLHADGSRHHTHDRDAFLQGTGAMTMFEIGKKRAGRLLDCVEHNGMPRLVLCAGVN